MSQLHTLRLSCPTFAPAQKWRKSIYPALSLRHFCVSQYFLKKSRWRRSGALCALRHELRPRSRAGYKSPSPLTPPTPPPPTLPPNLRRPTHACTAPDLSRWRNFCVPAPALRHFRAVQIGVVVGV